MTMGDGALGLTQGEREAWQTMLLGLTTLEDLEAYVAANPNGRAKARHLRRHAIWLIETATLLGPFAIDCLVQSWNDQKDHDRNVARHECRRSGHQWVETSYPRRQLCRRCCAWRTFP